MTLRGCALLFLTALVGVTLPLSASATNPNRIHGLTLTRHGDSAVIEIAGERAPNFTTFKQDAPRRVIVDVAECALGQVPADMQGDGALVERITTAQYGELPHGISRVVIGLRREAEYRVTTRGGSLFVTISPGAGGLLVSAGVPVAPERPARPTDGLRLPMEVAPPPEADAETARGTEESGLRVAMATEARERPAAEASEEPVEETVEEPTPVPQPVAEKPVAPVAPPPAPEPAPAPEPEPEPEPARVAMAAPVARSAAPDPAPAPVVVAQSEDEGGEEVEEVEEVEEIPEADVDEGAGDSPAEEAPPPPPAAEEVPPPPPAAEEVPPPPPAAEEVPSEVPEEAVEEVPPPPREEPPVGRSEVGERVEISGALKDMTWVGFQQTRQSSRVFVKTNAPVQYRVTEEGDNLVVLELENAHIPLRNNRRFLDTHFFDTAVTMITPREIEGVSRNVRIEIQLRNRVPFSAGQEDNLVFINFQRAD